jgi:hypothetical protein
LHKNTHKEKSEYNVQEHCDMIQNPNVRIHGIEEEQEYKLKA